MKDKKQAILRMSLAAVGILALIAAGMTLWTGFADSVEEFHTIYPEVPLRFFWDKADADEVSRIDETLSFYQSGRQFAESGLERFPADAARAGQTP